MPLNFNITMHSSDIKVLTRSKIEGTEGEGRMRTGKKGKKEAGRKRKKPERKGENRNIESMQQECLGLSKYSKYVTKYYRSYRSASA